MRTLVRRLALTFMILSAPVSATAQQALGLRGGASVTPEQVYVGAFWQSPRFAGPLRFQGGVDGGHGDDRMVLAINLDVLFAIPLRASGWSIVQGGGVVIANERRDTEPFRSEFETNAGASYVVSLGHTSGFFAEFRAAAGDGVPRLKFGAGWMIRLD